MVVIQIKKKKKKEKERKKERKEKRLAVLHHTHIYTRIHTHMYTHTLKGFGSIIARAAENNLNSAYNAENKSHRAFRGRL